MSQRFLALIIVLLTAQHLHAQEKKTKILLMSHTDTVSTTKKDTDLLQQGVPQRDMGDVFRTLFHKKSLAEDDSVTSKAEFSIIPAIGYTLTSGFAVVLSGNMAFRTGPKSRISTILGSADYTAKAQFTLPVQINI